MNPFDLIKNAANIKESLAKAESELDTIFVEGVSGGGLVKITLNGKFSLVSIELDPIAVDSRDVPMLQDLIRSAHTDAIEKIKIEIKNKLGPLAAGLPL